MNDRFVVRTQPYRIENQMVFHNFQKAKDFYYQIDKKGKGVQLLYQFITPQGQYEEHLWKDNRNPLKGSFTFDAENFGGDPEGKLAKALERARKKAKQPRKPLKIERLKAESPQVGDEGLLWSRYNNRRVRIVGIEDNSGKTNAIGNPLGDVYFYQDLLDSGEADWRIHTDSEREFLSRFKPDKRAESFGAENKGMTDVWWAYKIDDEDWKDYTRFKRKHKDTVMADNEMEMFMEWRHEKSWENDEDIRYYLRFFDNPKSAQKFIGRTKVIYGDSGDEADDELIRVYGKLDSEGIDYALSLGDSIDWESYPLLFSGNILSDYKQRAAESFGAEHKANLELIPYVYVEGIGIMSGDNAREHAPRPIVWDGYTVVDDSDGHELLDIPADGSPPLQDGEIDLIEAMIYGFDHPQINDGMGEFNVRGMFWTIQVMELLANYDPADYQSESFGAEAPSYMADSDAHKLMEASWRINSFVESTEDYPQWWKSKLSVAASNVDDLADYLDYAMSDDYDAESFNAENKKMVAFRYSDKSPAHICEGQGYTNTTRCGKPVNWDKVKNPFNLTAQKIDEILGSVDKKGMILHGSSQGKKICMKCFKKAETFNASTHNPYSVDLYEDEDTPPYYPYLAPEYTSVYGRGRYRFNRFGTDGMTHEQYRFPTKDKAIEWLCYTPHQWRWVKPNQPQYDFPPNTPDSEIRMWHRAESYGAETRSLAKRSWDALNNVETAVGTVGLAHMIGLGAIFGGGLAFLKGRKSNSKTEK
tara:strand:+ start:25331 stop:27604 length:2274 start_codon:yes stop_codon:yes gene_type:complete